MSNLRNLILCSTAVILAAEPARAGVQLQRSNQCTEAAATLSEWVAAQVMAYRPRPRRHPRRSVSRGRSSGGGGMGPPEQRDPDRAAADRRAGLLGED